MLLNVDMDINKTTKIVVEHFYFFIQQRQG
jgi:hypothetical protein